MVGKVGALGAIRAPRLTYSRCKLKNLGPSAPIKVEHCLEQVPTSAKRCPVANLGLVNP